MNPVWKRLTALGLTVCLSLPILAMPAQATQAEEQEAQEEVLVTAAEEETVLPEMAAEEEEMAQEAVPARALVLRQDHVMYMQGFPEGDLGPRTS